MAYWVIRLDNITFSDGQKIQFESGRRTKIRRGDVLVGFNRNELKFPWHATVEDISVLANNVTEEQKPIFSISVKIANRVPIESDLTLTDLSFSLLQLRRIKKNAQSRRYFVQKYSEISKSDFDTILGEKIFWWRTLFLSYYHSLPPSVRQEFKCCNRPVLEDLQKFKTFKIAWAHLRAFIEKEYLTLSELFFGINDQISKINDDHVLIDIKRFGFQFASQENVDGLAPDYFLDQHNAFFDFVNSLAFEGGQLFEKVENMANEQVKIQDEFEELFEEDESLRII